MVELAATLFVIIVLGPFVLFAIYGIARLIIYAIGWVLFLLTSPLIWLATFVRPDIVDILPDDIGQKEVRQIALVVMGGGSMIALGTYAPNVLALVMAVAMVAAIGWALLALVAIVYSEYKRLHR